MSSIPDLVRDNKLETSFEGKFTIHHYDESDGEEQRRSNQRSEYWEESELLARGGYGEVSLQRCVKGKRTHELRAVKRIAQSISRAKQFNYVSELETIAKFSHRRYSKCFVKLLGWYDTDDHLYIAMEYFPLGDLQQHMSKTGPMAETDVRVIVYQVLEGLYYMHREGFAHRDVKPGNVLIKSQPPERDWWVKLSDFGISKRIEGLTEMLSTVKGTLGYMAPELLAHEPGRAIQADSRAVDIWSLGEMVHRMLTASATFSSFNALFSYTIQPESVQFQELVKRGASGDVESFIRALMVPNPKNRLTSDKALEHTWIQPCRPYGVNLASSKTSTSAINPSGPSASMGTASWATESSIGSILSLRQDRNPGGLGSSMATWKQSINKPAPGRDGIRHPAITTPPLQGVRELGEDIVIVESEVHFETKLGRSDSSVKLLPPRLVSTPEAIFDSSKDLAVHAEKPKSTGVIKNSRRLASGSCDDTIKIWDLATGQCLSTLKGHTSSVRSIAWSYDAARLASGSSDGTVKIWDPATGQCISTLKGHTRVVNWVAWSYDSVRLASCSPDTTIKIWDSATGQCISTLKGHREYVLSVAWSPDAARLASSSYDRTIKIWDAATGQDISTLQGHNAPVISVAWSYDAARLVPSSSDRTVKIWDPATGRCISTLSTGWAKTIALSHDTVQLALGFAEKTVQIWDLTTGQCSLTLKGHHRDVRSVAWSHNAAQLASGSFDKTVKIWDPETGQCVSTLNGHSSQVLSVAWSPVEDLVL